MSQWAEIRALSAEGKSKREIARRLGLNVKTVRAALRRETAVEKRASPRRGRMLDVLRKELEDLLRRERRLTAKRASDLLRHRGVNAGERAWREFVAEVRAEVRPKEAFARRSPTAGDCCEFDFGESRAMVGGAMTKVKFIVAALPFSNAYFAKAYPAERMECLLDGIVESYRYFGGLTLRAVLDNTTLAVRQVLKGRERTEQRDFEAFRGALGLHVDYCAPAKGWEKGSVEGGVGYVKDNVFRPMPEVANFDALNAMIVAALERGMDERRVDGRTVREALAEERAALRELPHFPPETCRTVHRIADRFGETRVDGVVYNVSTDFVYRPLVCKLFHDRVTIAHEDAVIATHGRSFTRGARVIEPRFVLKLLERKHRAIPEAAAIKGWDLPTTFHELLQDLLERTKQPHREWVGVLRLTETHSLEDVEAAVKAARASGSPRLETVRHLLRRGDSAPRCAPAAVERPELAITLQTPDLAGYDALVGVGS